MNPFYTFIHENCLFLEKVAARAAANFMALQVNLFTANFVPDR